jgi:hypothetical protein
MVCNICACMISTCSNVGGGGRFPWFLSLLAFQFLVLAIWSVEEFMRVETRGARKMGKNEKRSDSQQGDNKW